VESIRISFLRESDVAAALELKEREHWNQTASDWKRLLKLGCFAAFAREELVGTVTTITYREDLAWIGMMLVAQPYRVKASAKSSCGKP